MSKYFNRRSLTLILFALVVTAALALILRDFVRTYIILPLLNVAWVAWIGMMSLPQVIYWGAFLLVTLFIIMRTLAVAPPPAPVQRGSGGPRYIAPSRYGFWQSGLASIANSSFAHERVERELQHLVIHVLAEQRRTAPGEVRDQILRGELDLADESPVIQELLLNPISRDFVPAPHGLGAWLARLFHRSPKSAIAPRLDIPAIVHWLDEQTGAL